MKRSLLLLCFIALLPAPSRAADVAPETVMVGLRDGVQLATDVHRVPDAKPAPVVLMRTPYDKDRLKGAAKRFVAAGYVTVVQDCRGTHASEGVLIPYNNEGQDGFDTMEWVVKQPWCNGRIGTWGSSYFGAVQWQAAVENPPGLAVMVPRATWSSFYRNLYLGGACRMLIARWAAGNSAKPEGLEPSDDWDAIYAHLPLVDIDEKIGWSIPWLDGIFAHPEPDGYWTRLELADQIADLRLPIQHVVGYYDFFSRESTGNFARMREQARDAKTRNQQQLILGPWDHGTIGRSKVGEVDFGPEATWDSIAGNIAWFDRFLKQDPAVRAKPFAPVRYFVMGDNQWREAQTWPPAGVKEKSFHLRSNGKANTGAGSGRLTEAPPSAGEPADSFRADPADPTPACPITEKRPLHAATWAPVDQRPIEERDDVLVYTSEPFDAPLTFAGNASAEIFVGVDTPDADWVVKLIDVHPDGFAQNLVVGIQRGRYRDSELHPKPMKPGEVYRLQLDLGPVAATIAKGHRLRVDVCGAYFPLFERNPNTGEGPTGSRTRVATEKVFHEPGRLSRVILPCFGD